MMEGFLHGGRPTVVSRTKAITAYGRAKEWQIVLNVVGAFIIVSTSDEREILVHHSPGIARDYLKSSIGRLIEKHVLPTSAQSRVVLVRASLHEDGFRWEGTG